MTGATSKQPSDYPWLKKYPAAVNWHADIKARPVHEILQETARDYPNHRAFDFLGKKFSWKMIDSEVNRLARALQQNNVTKGTRVGLFLPNSPYFLIGYYAILRAGGTVVNLNPLYAERELEHYIEDSETDIVITVNLKMLYDKMHKMLHNTRLNKIIVCDFCAALPFPKNILFRLFKAPEIAKVQHKNQCLSYSDLIKNSGKPDPVAIDPHKDVAVLQYTGGTTGKPKAAMLTHANVSANVEQAVMWFYKARFGEEKMLGVLPFFHVFAMTAVMNMAVRCAFEIIALPRFDLKATLKIIDKKKPHYFPAVPAIYSAINNHPAARQYDLSSLRYCISGGAALPVEVKKTFEDNTGCVVVEGYGLSESSPVACVNPITGENRPGSIGLPVPATEIKIIDIEDKSSIVEQGGRGELCIKGPQVMLGYWNSEQDNKATLAGGWLHTGDIAKMDEDGYLYIVDRLKDMIITNGYNVYPRNIEDAIYQHPKVEECVVAGLPDKARGEIVKAWIKPKEGHVLSPDDLKEFLADKLSPMEVPRKIEIRDTELPKTMIGKLSKKDLLAEET